MKLSRISTRLAPFVFPDLFVDSGISSYSVSLSLAISGSSDISLEEIILLHNSSLLHLSTGVGSPGICLFETGLQEHLLLEK